MILLKQRLRAPLYRNKSAVLLTAALLAVSLITFRLYPVSTQAPAPIENVKIKEVALANPHGPHCLYIPKSGWGNTVYLVLSFGLQAQRAAAILQNGTGIDLRTAGACEEDHDEICVHYSFPCVVVDDTDEVAWSFGRLLTQLFVHLHPCPVDPLVYNQTTCPMHAATQDGVHWRKIAVAAIEDYQSAFLEQKQNSSLLPLLPNIFELNASFVGRVMGGAEAPIEVKDLMPSKTNNTGGADGRCNHPSVCAIQCRFGDYWTRSRHQVQKDNKDKRLCHHYEKHEDGAREQCFAEEAAIILSKACPDPSIPIYLATDWGGFARYMCEEHRVNEIQATTAATENNHQNKRHFASKCPKNDQNKTLALHNTHIQDVDLGSKQGSMTLYEMITDWVVLILAEGCETQKRVVEAQTGQARHSTFLSSTCYPWELVW